jgi:hypothetical protein
MAFFASELEPDLMEAVWQFAGAWLGCMGG